MTPINDNVWHHLGFIWSNVNGRWEVLIDGTPRAIRNSVKISQVIPGGGSLVIGQHYATSGFQADGGLLGQISGVNIWDTAFSGEEVELLAQSRRDEKGNILRWFNVLKNIVGNFQVVKPSIAQNTSKSIAFSITVFLRSIRTYRWGVCANLFKPLVWKLWYGGRMQIFTFLRKLSLIAVFSCSFCTGIENRIVQHESG